jgi:hypothetical protein
MKHQLMACGIALFHASVAYAQEVPESHVASPEIYKILAEDEKFRIIEATWRPGQRDVWHSHPTAYQYHVNDCAIRITMRDGSSRVANPKSGTSRIAEPVESHFAENIGTSDCTIVFFEPKT